MARGVNKVILVGGIMFIMQELLPLEDNIPIRCFDQKTGVFFIYRNDNWITMTALEFDQLLDHISKLVIQEFGIWQIENQEKILESNNDEYEENVIKITLNSNLHDSFTINGNPIESEIKIEKK